MQVVYYRPVPWLHEVKHQSRSHLIAIILIALACDSALINWFISICVSAMGEQHLQQHQDKTWPLITFHFCLGCRGKSTQVNHTSLIKLDGVESKAEVDFYLGKRLAYIYKARTLKKGSPYRVIWGKVRRWEDIIHNIQLENGSDIHRIQLDDTLEDYELSNTPGMSHWWRVSILFVWCRLPVPTDLSVQFVLSSGRIFPPQQLAARSGACSTPAPFKSRVWFLKFRV